MFIIDQIDKKIIDQIFQFKKNQQQQQQQKLANYPQFLEKSNNSISWKQLDRPMADWQMDRQIDRRMERHTEE